MYQHHLSRANSLARHQRRAIGQGGNGARAKLRVGLGQNLLRDGDIRRYGQAMKRAFLSKVSQGLRLAPAHGPAHRPTTFAQAHRHQRVLLAARQITGRQTRPGKAQQQPAPIQPI